MACGTSAETPSPATGGSGAERASEACAALHEAPHCDMGPSGDPRPAAAEPHGRRRMVGVIAAVRRRRDRLGGGGRARRRRAGRGVVVAPSRLQEVTSLDGGIVAGVCWSRPAQAVKAGPVCWRGSTPRRPTPTSARAGSSSSPRWPAARASRRCSPARRRVSTTAWQREAPELIDKETQLWRDALREHQATLAGRRARPSARAAREIAEARARIPTLTAGGRRSAKRASRSRSGCSRKAPARAPTTWQRSSA